MSIPADEKKIMSNILWDKILHHSLITPPDENSSLSECDYIDVIISGRGLIYGKHGDFDYKIRFRDSLASGVWHINEADSKKRYYFMNNEWIG